MKTSIKVVLGVLVLGMGLASCSNQSQLVAKTPNMTRTAYIFEDRVEIVTRTTLSLEQYQSMVATTETNRNNK